MKIRLFGTGAALPLAVLAGACGVTDPPEGFPVAWMVAGCSPVDGPAVDLILAESLPAEVTQPTYPYIRISVEAGAEELAGNVFSTQSNPPRVFLAHRCSAEGQCVSATKATVEFDGNGGSTYEYSGILNLTFPDGLSVQGSFQATLHASLMLCG